MDLLRVNTPNKEYHALSDDKGGIELLTIVKVIVHLALIPVIVWIIQLIIAFVQGIREGIQEDKEEKQKEQLKKADGIKETEEKVETNIMKPRGVDVPLLERVTIALACPFREIQISSKGEGEPHLQRLGRLDDDEKESLKKVLSRDFDFSFDVEGYDSVGIQMLGVLSRLDGTSWGVVMTTSIQLHIITACVDLGYIRFDDYKNLACYYIQKIRNCDLQSWKEYADEFLKEEKNSGLNGRFGRMLLKYQTGRLLEKEDSPWVNLPWESVMTLNLKKQYKIPLLNPQEHLQEWKADRICIVSDKITVDGCKVGCMRREEPIDDEDKDSGWVFWEGSESEEYRNWGNMEPFSLYVVCSYDPDIIPYLDAPYGSEFVRDSSGKFQMVDSK